MNGDRITNEQCPSQTIHDTLSPCVYRMPETLFLIKFIVSVTVVIGLSVFAEKGSARVAGILSGYPAGSAINLFFFGLEIGPDFAAESAVYNMVGLVATQSCIYFYYKASSVAGRFNILLSSLAAVASYFVVVWLLHFIRTSSVVALTIPLLSVPFFIFLFRRIPNVKIRNRVPLTFGVLLLRALFAASSILLITGTARSVGATYAGLFSAFPSTMFPFMLIIHATYGAATAHTVIKNYPIGSVSLIFYSLTVSLTYPVLGIYLGTLLCFIVATVCLVAYEIVRSRISRAICT